ncbi:MULTISPECIES: AAA family ATPase [Intestinimonas]|jgi:cytidylate kinase|uniref:Cytidylate kinase-like family protein n=1 Tax=Intestinimonas massiliensis (ex Afouda et al. 2020) TaxID=1673721 RepID=A0AAW5JPH5_9FIRM|nr:MULTISPECIES: cytidylate kinase-like family protein [Intestinimonas]MBS6282257.1 cytidylate kinase-like family protein [Oscillospiraceae bacterium]MCG4528253.1 cytidylate kinase-like family protein [Intestinimonas massiliensis (ex Afouda et al. 2020)]MCQ4771248.1 cytidylate kinase-like family protein [Intestinimonas massiliensis (ex Afouda et al. 2020)]MCQ4807655.1 cytidylate kinase-like family protein [Intestinimonas massiliensis (ex Afouda et al. 2020)]
MAHTVITVGREYGSGGRLIAQKAAEALGIPFFDRSIINMAAEETGLSADFIRRTEQQKTSSFLYNLYMSTQSLPVNDQVFIAQSEVIRRVAAEGPCIIVGRCADYVLRNQSGVDALNLFIHAPMEERIRRVREEYKVQAPDLRLYILKQDKNRAAYYEHFTDGQWGKAQNYHLAVSSGLGLETIVRLLTDLMRDRGLGA